MIGNNTTNLSPRAERFLVYWGMWSVLILLSLMIIIGNLLICFMFSCWKQLRTPTNTFLVMLAVADLLVGMLFIPLYIGGHYIEYNSSVNVSDNLDIIILFTFFASVFNLYAVTFDRYIAVLHALRYNAFMTTRNISLIVLTAWLSPTIITSVLVICKFMAQRELMYVLFGMEIAFLVIPGFLMVLVYVKIFIEARRQIGQVASLEVGESVNRASASRRRAEFRVAKTCALLLFVFVLCWLPTCIEQIMDMAQIEISITYRDTAIILMVSNSAVNPFLYGLCKKDFRCKLKKMLRIKDNANASEAQDHTEETNARKNRNNKISSHSNEKESEQF